MEGGGGLVDEWRHNNDWWTKKPVFAEFHPQNKETGTFSIVQADYLIL